MVRSGPKSSAPNLRDRDSPLKPKQKGESRSHQHKRNNSNSNRIDGDTGSIVLTRFPVVFVAAVFALYVREQFGAESPAPPREIKRLWISGPALGTCDVICCHSF